MTRNKEVFLGLKFILWRMDSNGCPSIYLLSAGTMVIVDSLPSHCFKLGTGVLPVTAAHPPQSADRGPRGKDPSQAGMGAKQTPGFLFYLTLMGAISWGAHRNPQLGLQHGVGLLPDSKVRDAKVREGLPGLDEAHLGLGHRELGHVLVGFQDPWCELWNPPVMSCTPCPGPHEA